MEPLKSFTLTIGMNEDYFTDAADVILSAKQEIEGAYTVTTLRKGRMVFNVDETNANPYTITAVFTEEEMALYVPDIAEVCIQSVDSNGSTIYENTVTIDLKNIFPKDDTEEEYET